MSQNTKLTPIPIITFSKETQQFRSKLVEFLIENSIDLERNLLIDENNDKNTTFNTMIRIFNIKKNSTPKKYPKQIRSSIYQNLICHPISQIVKREKSKLKTPKPKKKPIKQNLLTVEQPKPKKYREIRGSVYSHLIKRQSPKKVISKDYEEMNKMFQSPNKKRYFVYHSQKNSPNETIRSLSQSQERSENKDKFDKNMKNIQIKNEINEQKNGNNKKTNQINTERNEQKNTNKLKNTNINQKSPQTELKKTTKQRENNISTTKKPQQKNNKIKQEISQPTPYNSNSDNTSIEIPSVNISLNNKTNEDILNKTYEFKKTDYSFHAANSDEELKELFDKIKPKSGFHANKSLENQEESESFKKTIAFLEESAQDVDNKDLAEKLDLALKLLEIQKTHENKSIETKFDEEFVKTLMRNSKDLDKNLTANTVNKNFEKMVDRFFVGMEFLSTQELLYYYKFIVDRARHLYVKFLKNRGLLNN